MQPEEFFIEEVARKKASKRKETSCDYSTKTYFGPRTCMPYTTDAKKISPEPMRVLNEKHIEMGGMARLKVYKNQTYFLPKDINPYMTAVAKSNPEPSIVYHAGQRNMDGSDILKGNNET